MGVHPDIQRLIHDTFGSLTSDCVPEGAALERMADDALAEHRRGETEPMVPDRLPQLVALTLRVRRLEAALNDVNNYAQGLTFRLEALERAQKRQAAEQATTLALEVRALDAAREVA